MNIRQRFTFFEEPPAALPQAPGDKIYVHNQ